MSIQFTYDSKTVDLLIDNDALLTNYLHKRQQHRSGSGKIETVNQYGIQEISFAGIFDEDTYEDLLAWWSYVRQGASWAFAFDSDNAAATTLSAAAASGQTTLEVNDNTGFKSGNIILVKSVLDDKFEIAVLETIGGGGQFYIVDESGNFIVDDDGTFLVSEGESDELEASGNLKFSYVAGDIVQHYDYWPEVICIDNHFEPKRENNYYKHIFKFVALN